MVAGTWPAPDKANSRRDIWLIGFLVWFTVSPGGLHDGTLRL